MSILIFLAAIVPAGEVFTCTPEWVAKVVQSRSKSGAVKSYDTNEIAAYRMASTAFKTAAGANGQIIERFAKQKDIGFPSQRDLEKYILALFKQQDWHCALTEIPLNMDEKGGEPELRASLDRIDSGGHYAPNNLQIVCKFANRWKGVDQDDDFRRVISIVRQYA